MKNRKYVKCNDKVLLINTESKGEVKEGDAVHALVDGINLFELMDITTEIESGDSYSYYVHNVDTFVGSLFSIPTQEEVNECNKFLDSLSETKKIIYYVDVIRYDTDIVYYEVFSDKNKENNVLSNRFIVDKNSKDDIFHTIESYLKTYSQNEKIDIIISMVKDDYIVKECSVLHIGYVMTLDGKYISNVKNGKYFDKIKIHDNLKEYEDYITILEPFYTTIESYKLSSLDNNNQWIIEPNDDIKINITPNQLNGVRKFVTFDNGLKFHIEDITVTDDGINIKKDNNIVRLLKKKIANNPVTFKRELGIDYDLIITNGTKTIKSNNFI